MITRWSDAYEFCDLEVIFHHRLTDERLLAARRAFEECCVKINDICQLQDKDDIEAQKKRSGE